MKDRQLFSIFADIPEVTSADFSNQDFSDAEFLKMCEGLKHNSHLVSLNLLYCSIDKRRLDQLLEAILTNKSLQKIKLTKYLDYSSAELDEIKQIESHVTENKGTTRPK